MNKPKYLKLKSKDGGRSFGIGMVKFNGKTKPMIDVSRYDGNGRLIYTAFELDRRSAVKLNDWLTECLRKPSQS